MGSLWAVSTANSLTVPKTKTAFLCSPLMPRKTQQAVMMARRSNVEALKVQASLKEKAVTGMTAAALTAAMVMPDVAEAAELTPSLKNFLLSIFYGGVVLIAIVGAVIVVANFDPVKRQ